MRPSRTFALDGYAWSHSKSGAYTVKSGYEISRKNTLSQTTHEVLEPSITALKSQVWKSRTSKKLKHFMWQALSGCVATNQRLNSRHLSVEKGCLRCGAEEETINHLIFECPIANQVWASSDYLSLPGCFPSTSLYQNMDYLFWKTEKLGLSDPGKDIYPWIIWFIWKARNEKVFDGKDIPSGDTLQLAIIEAESWNIANQKENDEELISLHPPNNLAVPPATYPFPTCQTDASWTGHGPVSGLGWCLKDNMGQISVGMKGCRTSLSALHAEMDGLIWAMECLRDRQILSAKFETDCSDLLKIIENPIDWPAFTTEVDYLFNLREDFQAFVLCLIPRTQNVRADCLAKRARARGFLFSHVSHTELEWLIPMDIHSTG